MAGADDIWGHKYSPKAPTAAETLRPWGLDKTTGQAADQAADDGVADYQRTGSGAFVDPADKADSDSLAWLKNKWQQEQHQTSGGYVTLPTFGDTLPNKEGSASAENNLGNYLGKSFNQFLRGNYTDDVTALGTAGQIAAGLFDADLPMDIRDLTYDITLWQNTPGHIGQTVLDAIGLIPVIGAVKYADELGTLAKNSDVIGKLMKIFGKNADEAAGVAKEAEDVAKGAGNAGKIPWNSWQNYEKVTQNGQTYAKVGDRLYSEHAVNRMQPSGNRFGVNIYEGLNGKDYGRSIAPQYVEDVISSTKPVYQPRTGNYSHVLGNVEVIVNPQGAVVTILTYK